jgi:hemerythrin superfamily protein
MEIFSVPTLDLKVPAIAQKLRVDIGTIDRLLRSIIQAMEIKAAFRTCYLDGKKEDAVTIESIRFVSRVLAHNLSEVGKVFPFVLTLGSRVDAVIEETADILERYLLDEIGNIVLRESIQEFERHLLQKFAFDKMSYIAPGSLQDWPIVEQKKLFALLSDIESAISVRLTDTCLMIPRKSVSGIYFPSTVAFCSCQLCPRERCDSRKSRFDESKVSDYGTSFPV